MDKTASGILERLKSAIPSRYDTSEGSYMHDVLAPVAIEMETAYAYVEKTGKRLLIATATGGDLDIALGQLGFTRKGATYSEGEVTVTGANGATLEKGALVGAGKQVYEILETVELTEGSVTVPVRATVAGSAGNVAAGAVNYFPVTLPKITSVTNEKAFTGGADAETDAEYLGRYQYFLDHPVTSGNQYEYEMWALEIDEVGRARCIPVWNGGGTVKVVIVTRDLQPAGPDLIQKVQEHIEGKRLTGVDLTVDTAETVSLNVSASVVLDGSVTLEEIETAYKTALAELLKEIDIAGGVVPYGEIAALLQSMPGVSYYDPNTLLVNGAIGNVFIEEGQLAIVGGVTLA